jgi:2-amino-4-hydroxy-6-hydroxymethyldihydropteridine diphosphokinase
MAIAYLGLGSNLGDRARNIREALDRLPSAGIQVLKTSSLMESEPAGGPPQNDYLNAVTKVSTSLNPLDLLSALKSIETRMGRIKTVRNGPRVIDIDILLFEGVTMRTDTLTIPHPRMRQRAFVMNPLKEIEPELNLNEQSF